MNCTVRRRPRALLAAEGATLIEGATMIVDRGQMRGRKQSQEYDAPTENIDRGGQLERTRRR